MKKQIRKIAVQAAILLVLTVAFASFTSADSFELWCLSNNQEVDFRELCNPRMREIEGPANICVHLLDNGRICPAVPNVCNSLGLSCSNTGNTTVDQEPPTLQISSPLNGGIYTRRAIVLSLQSDESADIFYKFNSEPGNRWRQVCFNCRSYSGQRSFDEGLNNLTFKATDSEGNTAFLDWHFYVDSSSPRIHSTIPADGFASGNFEVVFEEENPSSVILNYGNSESGFRQKNLNLNSECALNNNYICQTNVDLSDYNNEEIQYFFSVTDIAGNSVSSAEKFVNVDNSAPIINSFTNLINGKYVTFSFDITENNFKEITYIDESESRPRERRICQRLINNQCEKRISFRDGEHDLTIYVRDLAENTVTEEFEFFTDSKPPKISQVEPKNGFASGNFYIKFKEENPASVNLHYGNEETGFRDYLLNVGEDCSLNNNNYECNADVDLEDYDGESILYSFTVADVAAQSKSSREITLGVDTSFPVINSIEQEINSNTLTLTLDVTENNLAEVTYVNENDSRPREKRLCARLRNGICEGRIRLNPGSNIINLQISDKAGNSIAQNIEVVL